MSENQLHFIAVVNVDHDLDILTPWVAHYARLSFDKYVVWLYSQHKGLEIEHALGKPNPLSQFLPPVSDPNIDAAAKTLKDAGFEVRTACGFDGGLFTARGSIFHDYAKSVHPSTMLIMADVDEFQIISLEHYHDILRTYPAIGGTLVDCWDESLHPATPGTALRGQYPRRGDINDELDPIYKPQVGDRTLPRSRSKIVAALASIPVSYFAGHHLEESSPVRPYHAMEIEHYAWRSVKQIATLPYTQDRFEAIMKYFNIIPQPLLDPDILPYFMMKKFHQEDVARQTFPEYGPVDEVLNAIRQILDTPVTSPGLRILLD